MDDISKLIANVEACALSLKGTVDSAVMRLKGMQDAMLKCDQTVAEKQAWRDEQIARMRGDIQAEANAKGKAVREREIAENERDKVVKDIERVKAEYDRIVDRIITTPTAA
jgi:hypothetical protein